MALCLAFLVITSCSKDDGCETKTYYLDSDGDSFGDDAKTKTACKKPKGNYVLQGGDTDDGDDNVNPDCANKFYEDADNDGEGDPNTEVLACNPPVVQGKTFVVNKLDPNDKDESITSTCSATDEKTTFYLDEDNDGFGVESEFVLACTNPDPDRYTANGFAFDCNDDDDGINPDTEVIYYKDSDEDGYGSNDNNDKEIRAACDPEPDYKFALQGGDCNDDDENINPGVTDDDPTDDIDSDCDGTLEITGTIWTGPDFNFSQDLDAPYPGNTDEITQNIALIRLPVQQHSSMLTNIQWWSDTFNQFPNDNDLAWEYMDDTPTIDVGSEQPSAGPQGLRWAILEPGGDTQSWQDFDLYGTLGNPAHFYSLNNIVSICAVLDGIGEDEQLGHEYEFNGVENDFTINSNFSGADLHSYWAQLVGKTLGVWIEEDNIYFTITFTEFSYTDNSMSYTRSTPAP